MPLKSNCAIRVKFPCRICIQQLHIVIIKFIQVVIEFDLQLDINAKLDLESQIPNHK